MYCPFRKIITQTERKIGASSTNTETITKEEFNVCHEEKCQAYNDKETKCKMFK